MTGNWEFSYAVMVQEVYVDMYDAKSIKSSERFQIF